MQKEKKNDLSKSEICKAATKHSIQTNRCQRNNGFRVRSEFALESLFPHGSHSAIKISPGIFQHHLVFCDWTRGLRNENISAYPDDMLFRKHLKLLLVLRKEFLYFLLYHRLSQGAVQNFWIWIPWLELSKDFLLRNLPIKIEGSHLELIIKFKSS